MSYRDTFITISDDCPVEKSEIPQSDRSQKPVHLIQYELLTRAPYTYDHEELIFQTYLIRQNLTELSSDEKQEIRDQLFSRGHPCLRASALTKRYGYGAHYDHEGRIALYPLESAEYQQFLHNTHITKFKGMKNKDRTNRK